ncbi:MAG: aldo/keto reductase [Acidobacteriaceae bacterium]|nr:aldo/keto reductase [Acidobacteriaceae bacterium]MBV8571788.1 aldo/keto reductase [Acidobacteriaceae bacterium]
MQQRMLGRTGLSVSVIGFGAAPLGNEYGDLDPRDGQRAVHTAIEEGINFFDTSPYYGRTLSEERLGEALLGRRERVVLSTKCGRYDRAKFDFSAARVTASLDESLARLRTDYVDILLAHDIEFGSVEQVLHETIPAMRKLQKQGKARWIGISGLPIRLLATVAVAGQVDVVLSYCHYNLMIRDLNELLVPSLEKNQIGLINASPLHMGMLTHAGPPPWHPAAPEIKEAARRVVSLCAERGLNPAVLGLNFALQNKYISSTLVGISHPAQVKENLEALTFKADPELLDAIEETIAPVKGRSWPSGRPENNL